MNYLEDRDLGGCFAAQINQKSQTMKKIILSLALVTATVFIATAQARFGVQVGGVGANVNGEDAGEDLDFDTRFGFTVGAAADIPLAESFRFRPALNFLQKGARDEFDFMGSNVKINMSLNYLELPLNFVYAADAGTGKFVVGLGPTLGFGLSGTLKTEVDGAEDEEDINFGDQDDELKSFEFSGNLLAGYEFANGLFIHANYNMGFSDLSNVSDSKWKNNYFGLRLGYWFGGDKK